MNLILLDGVVVGLCITILIIAVPRWWSCRKR